MPHLQERYYADFFSRSGILHQPGVSRVFPVQSACELEHVVLGPDAPSMIPALHGESGLFPSHLAPFNFG